MEELTTMATYREFKQTLDTEVKKVADGFVKMGYLFKIARDTEILQESGYKTVAEFAKTEYGFDKDVVSRYIAINDRYSVNGYSEQLQDKYQQYGYAKLAEMLILSDEVIESINPSLTRREIQQIKEEIKEESKISELEVMVEEKDPAQVELDTTLAKALHQYCKDNPNDYIGLWEAVNKTQDTGRGEVIEKIMDAIAPSGTMTIMVRIAGLGRVIIGIDGKEKDITLVNARSSEKETYTWQQMTMTLEELCLVDYEPKEAWETLYGEEFPEEPEEVASVQQKSEPKKVEKPKALKISTPRENKKEDKVDNSTKQEEESGEEEQILGQAQITDYPELLPDDMQEPEEEHEDEEEEPEDSEPEAQSNPQRITDAEVVSDHSLHIRFLKDEAWEKVKIINESLGAEDYETLIKATIDLHSAAETLQNMMEETNE